MLKHKDILSSSRARGYANNKWHSFKVQVVAASRRVTVSTAVCKQMSLLRSCVSHSLRVGLQGHNYCWQLLLLHLIVIPIANNIITSSSSSSSSSSNNLFTVRKCKKLAQS